MKSVRGRCDSISPAITYEEEKMLQVRRSLVMILAVAALSTTVQAGLVEFWNDAEGWHSAVGHHESVDFTQFPPGTQITDQFDGFTVDNLTFIHNSASFSDGHGLRGRDGILLQFDTPQHALAVEHLGVVRFTLYLKSELVGTTTGFSYPGVPGPVYFSGVTSGVPFDEVYMFRPMPPFPSNVISIDTLYWGTIPAPGALALLGIAFLQTRRRRLQ